MIGDNLKFGVIGGACISRDTEEFANICFGCFKQVYGTSEILAVLFARCRSTLNSFICGDTVSSGYYNNDKQTKEKFVIDPVTQKRWFKSGDIAIIKKDGTFIIVDRKSEIVKLQNSTFFSLSKIENKILKCPLVENACVFPVKNFEYFVALVVPNAEKVKEFLTRTQITKENEDINEFKNDPDIIQLISRHIQVSIKQEFPRKFHIVFDEWLPSNNLLTPTFKLRRHELKKKYADLLLQ
ncbi:hypothetical protein MXB_66 [Myxobolus squamalis]|nr:hypothetical protein MXB_66 [Myxobolus squamalis]